MRVSQILMMMVEESQGSLHDVEHFLKVYAYAGAIGREEGLDPQVQQTLEIAALLHDIACPQCRAKYGSAIPRRQEEEGEVLARQLLARAQLPQDQVERVAYLVGHHHTLSLVDGPDYQILLEADYLVNAGESHYPQEDIRRAYHQWFKTRAGRRLLQALYGPIPKDESR